MEEVRERYKEEIIPVPLFVIKYIIKQGYCKHCDKVVYPEVPDTIGNRHFGVRFLLYIDYLRCVMNLPKNKIATLLNDTYEANVSIGTVVDYLKKAAELFGDEYKRIKDEMRESRICNYDDTGQRVNGKNKWLWAFVSKEMILYLTSKNHGEKVVIKVLGEDYDGVTGQDFYPEFYEGISQIYEDAKEAERILKAHEDRESVYAEFVKRLEKFVTQEGNANVPASCMPNCSYPTLSDSIFYVPPAT